MKTLIKSTLMAGIGLAFAMGAASAQTKLKWAHVYETSEAFHTESLWAAAEFAKLIVAQRAYSANTKIITTSDEMLQETINLKR